MGLNSGTASTLPSITPGQPFNVPENTTLTLSLTYALPGLSAGNYQLVMQLLDGSGAVMEASLLDIVSQSPVVANKAPTVFIAATSPVTLPDSASLTAQVKDDGLPEGSVITHQWSVISAPDGQSAVIADPAALDTTVSFSGAGDYVIGFTASDGELSTSNQLAITVNPETTGSLLIASVSGPTIT